MIGRWPRVKVSELCDLIVDCVNKTAPHLDYVTPFKMIRTPNVKKGRINLKGCRYVEEATFEKWTRRAKLKRGDVLLTREAPMGEVGIINYDDPNTFLGQRLVQYRTDSKKLDPHFLLYSFLSPDLQYQFRRYNNSGSIVSHIRVPDCFEFEINVPPVKEQKRIAKVLSELDAKIELNNRINAELEGMAKLIYDYWFVQFDFPISAAQAQVMGKPELEGKPYKSSGGKMVYNEELKREIPEGWEVDNMLAISDLIGGGTPNTKEKSYWGGDVPFFTPRDAENTVFKIVTAENITNQGLANCSSKLLPKGTIIITARGSVGNLIISGQTMAMNQSCYALKPHDLINSPFVYFGTNTLVKILKAKSSGSVFKSIVSNDIKFTYLAIPNLELIQFYGEFSLPLFDKILNNQKQNQHLSSLRDWLLPMLMNGLVKVGEVAEDLSMVAEPEVNYGQQF